jgi:signal transduction histidine kinase
MSEVTASEAQREQLLATLTKLLALPATTVRATLFAACDCVAAALGAEKVDAFLHEPASESLVAVGTNDSPMSRQQRAIGLDRLPLVHGGRSAQVFTSGEPHLGSDIAGDPQELRALSEVLGVRSTLTVPLTIRGKRRGVIAVSSATPDKYTQGDLMFLAAVAEWVGVVTHRAELVEEATRGAAQRARQRAAEELVAVVAHDLRNHLAPLSTRIAVLELRAVNEGRERDVADVTRLRRGLERLERVIADLLAVERLERGLFTPKLERVDLAELARETAALMSTPSHPIDVEAAARAPVDADPRALRQILENLLHNAHTHSPEGRGMTVSIGNEPIDGGERTVLRVRDFGPGIAPELLPTLFERFTAGPSSSGLGLGLYLARGLAQAHGGTLTVEDPEGPGACFRLSLPLAADAPAGDE